MVPQRILHKNLSYTPNSVSVARPSEFGNPFSHKTSSLAKFKVSSKSIAVFEYYKWISSNHELLERAKKLLKGKHLACFCELGHPCHADILLALVNDFPLPSFIKTAESPIIQEKLFPD